VLALGRASELHKEISLNGEGEEALLGLLAVVIHHVTNDGEVHVELLRVLVHLVSGLYDEQIVLGVPVREQEHHHGLDHLQLLQLGQLGVEQTRAQLLGDERLQVVVHLLLTNVAEILEAHLRFLSFGSAREARVRLLEKLVHVTETRSEEEEVELLVLPSNSVVRLARVHALLARKLTRCLGTRRFLFEVGVLRLSRYLPCQILFRKSDRAFLVFVGVGKS